jgi:hypothetical protein
VNLVLNQKERSLPGFLSGFNEANQKALEKSITKKEKSNYAPILNDNNKELLNRAIFALKYFEFYGIETLTYDPAALDGGAEPAAAHDFYRENKKTDADGNLENEIAERV